MLYECCLYPRKHHGAVYEKYATPKYKQSSTFIEDKMASGVTFAQLYAGSLDEDHSFMARASIPTHHQPRCDLIPVHA
jgi:hypothetical protein